MADQLTGDPPSPFVVRWATALVPHWPPAPRALDLAMGRGRHARVLAALGFEAYGVDIRFDAVLSAARDAAREGLVVRGWCADLTVSPLPRHRFELVVVTRYLQRDLLGDIAEALVPGGVVIYETFTVNQRRHGTGPTSPHHLLEEGELGGCFGGFEILADEEVLAPEAVARLVARKPTS